MRTELLPPSGRILCAVSGGADSMALLHMLWTAGREVAAAHYEHGLRGEESLRDAAFVEDWCREREIPCLTEHGDAAAWAARKGLGLEEAARELRYAFLERAADALGCVCIATAHTADDNAETVLFHLLRGSGAAGLGGIPPKRGRIVRPLLDTTRAEIESYLAANGVSHVEDSSNAADDCSRNLLRHRVLPPLRELNPSFSAAVERTARLLRQDEDCLNAQAAAFLESAFDGESLPLSALRALHPAVASRAIRGLWPRSLSCEQTESALRFAEGTERGYLDLPGGRLRRERGRLYFGREPEPVVLPERVLRPNEPLRLPEAGLRLSCEEREKSEEINGLFKTYDLKCETIRGVIRCTGPREGDRFHPAGRGCGKSLRALFAERGLTRRERERVPVLRDEEGILAVPGFGQDARSLALPGERVLRVTWTDDSV